MAVMAVMLVATLAVTACAPKTTGGDGKPAEQTRPATVTDLAGREVRIPESVERVVAIGPGALRLMVYAGGTDLVVGIEDFETQPPLSRPYTMANPQLLELPKIGVGGPDSAADAERLLSVEPDVIFLAQIADAEGAEKLQTATGIPVVVVSYGALGLIDEDFFTSLKLVGTVLGTTERAEEAAATIRGALDDLASRTSGVADADKPTVFVGGLGFKGAHGLESTQAKYLPFGAIGARNVAAEIKQQGAIMIDKEKLLEWNPDYIFVDRSGLSLVLEDVAKNRALYEGLAAVKNGHVYSQLPFNNYWTNVELALANAYYTGSVMYPAEFKDVDIAAKTDELSTALVGAPVHDALVTMYKGGFDRIDLLKAR